MEGTQVMEGLSTSAFDTVTMYMHIWEVRRRRCACRPQTVTVSVDPSTLVPVNVGQTVKRRSNWCLTLAVKPVPGSKALHEYKPVWTLAWHLGFTLSFCALDSKLNGDCDRAEGWAVL